MKEEDEIRLMKILFPLGWIIVGIIGTLITQQIILQIVG